MKNKEIEQAEKELSEIEKLPLGPDEQAIKDFLRKYGIHQISLKEGQGGPKWVRQMFEHAHTFLQTKMMSNACTTAKWSCIWAAVAATVAALGVILGCYTYLFKTIMLMFKSIF